MDEWILFRVSETFARKVTALENPMASAQETTLQTTLQTTLETTLKTTLKTAKRFNTKARGRAAHPGSATKQPTNPSGVQHPPRVEYGHLPPVVFSSDDCQYTDFEQKSPTRTNLH